MNLLTIIISYLKHTVTRTVLHLLLLIFGIATLTTIIMLTEQMSNRFIRDSGEVDVVIGAKGSPLQLVLSSVYHMDIPTGVITMGDYQSIKNNKQIKTAIPIATGDSYQSFRIISTEPSYLDLYSPEFASGQLWNTSMEAVLGAQVAKASGLQLGDTFVGAHGLLHEGHDHDDYPYTVVGVLKPTGTMLDKLIITDLASTWMIHDHDHQEHDNHHDSESHHHDHEAHNHNDTHDEHHHHDESHNHDHQEHEHHHNDDKEITAVLAQYTNQSASLHFPKKINEQTQLQAASIPLEITRLMNFTGLGTKSIIAITFVLLLGTLASMMIHLFESIRQRRYDIAIMRVMGASQSKLRNMIFGEVALVTSSGALIGLLVGHVSTEIIGSYLGYFITGWTIVPQVWYLALGFIALSLLVSQLPARQASKANIRSVLMESGQ